MFLWPVVVPLLVLDEMLQYFYDRVACKWQVTAGGEEILCAALYAAKACYMMVKIWLKQTVRLVKRQWARAASRPGGLSQLAQDTAKGTLDAASKLAGAIAGDPSILWTKVGQDIDQCFSPCLWFLGLVAGWASGCVSW